MTRLWHIEVFLTHTQGLEQLNMNILNTDKVSKIEWEWKWMRTYFDLKKKLLKKKL